ncbi:TolC family protein [Candidatus Sulfurimonas baltica]|uniref:TolC family protein n=1 Tax=Candidatus Sulfurimonas baltica TaxID=2740404 RepID=A0A7S7LXZ6_9BACT|nr:TolC family protein [Candidatus Sulfurimonas baltica]QOY52938.1 TolC family protein [Candidatus Sulfurimonas baltica]
MIRKIIILTSIVVYSVLSQELFTEDEIKKYMTHENPYVYTSLGKKYIYEQKLNYAMGEYDTNVLAKYEDKEYPVSYGKYYTIGLEKPLENGVDMSVSYRYADGTQEYNNIKTSQDGELILGIKVPVISLFSQIDKRRLNVGLASNDVVKTDFQYKESMRSLYYNITQNYYKLLYLRSLCEIYKRLLLKVEKRYAFLEQGVEKGNVSEMKLIELKQQVINAEQMVISADTNYNNQFMNFIKFINLSKKNFDEKYILPELPKIEATNIEFDNAMNIALQNRVDLKIFNNEIQKVNLKQKYTQLLKYPDLHVGLYGVYDMKDDSEHYDQTGFKVTLNMSFPIEQSKYSANNLENKYSLTLLDADKKRLFLELETNLKNIIFSLYALEKNIEKSQNELELIKKLENMEKKKYDLGSSTLFMLNQREIQTIETEKKLLKNTLEYLLIYQEYINETNLYSAGS